MSTNDIPERANADRLADEAVALFQPRTTRKLTREDGREITRNLTGFFGLLLKWDRERRAQVNHQRTPNTAG